MKLSLLLLAVCILAVAALPEPLPCGGGGSTGCQGTGGGTGCPGTGGGTGCPGTGGGTGCPGAGGSGCGCPTHHHDIHGLGAIETLGLGVF